MTEELYARRVEFSFVGAMPAHQVGHRRRSRWLPGDTTNAGRLSSSTQFRLHEPRDLTG